MATVTTKERRRAQRQSREAARFQRKSSEAATRLGAKLMSRSLAAFKRVDALAIRDIIDKEFKKITPVMVELMTIAYLTGLDRLRVARKDSTIAAALLHREAQRALFQRLQISQDRLKELTTSQNVEAVRMLSRVQNGVEKNIQRAFIRINQQGLTTAEGVKELRKAFGKAGIVPVNSFEIEAVFRTQTNFAYSAGSWSAAQDPAVDEILWGYKYVTVGDARVRDEHILLDGTTAPKNDPIWQAIWPPNGWACRCQIIYIFDETETVLPQPREIDGRIVQPVPDPGFNFNPGTVLQPGGSSIRKPQAVGKKTVPVKIPKTTFLPPVKPDIPTPVKRWTDVNNLKDASTALDIDVTKAAAISKKDAVSIANVVGKEQTRLLRNHPKLEGVEISEIRVARAELTRIRADAAYDHGAKTIIIRAGSSSPSSVSAQKIVNKLKIRSITTHDAENLYRHEFGHAVQDQLLTAKNRQRLAQEFADVDVDLLRSQVSRYAATKSKEAFSELFNLIAGGRGEGITVMPATRRIIERILK